MRLNRLGAKLIAIFLFTGAAMTVGAVLLLRADGLDWASGVLGAMGACYVAASLAAIWVAVRARMRLRHNRWLARNGIRGTVTIVAAETEMSINEQPLFKLVCDLYVPGREPRRVERSLIVATFAARRMRPGMVLPARVNPRDADDVLIIW
jgi:hypothetical protein